MHRSGTSALCSALHACGASFGRNLLEAMPGVNNEGFWESADVVAINDELLQSAGADWYSVTRLHLGVDWRATSFDACRQRAREILLQGFGDGPVEAVKDPRLCLTLPFWMALCRDLQLPFEVCVVERDPLEVARSLRQRDAFPVGYGLRLHALYSEALQAAVPDRTLYIGYRNLLENPLQTLRHLADSVPLEIDARRLARAVDSGLQHQVATADESASLCASSSGADLERLVELIDQSYDCEQTLSEFSHRLVERGRDLSRIGESHSSALATINIRDEDIARLGAEHSHALATLDERDADLAKAMDAISELNRTVQRLQERDRHLQNMFTMPVMGYLFRAMWKYETH
ncbi:MAG: hypothetical protein U5K56_06945 [Halioglobus sp.]|nr:hypothetical protein [Halioglobus sp.]